MTKRTFNFIRNRLFALRVQKSALRRFSAIVLSAALHGLLLTAVLLQQMLNPSPVAKPIEFEVFTSARDNTASALQKKSGHLGNQKRPRQAPARPQVQTHSPIDPLFPSSRPHPEAFLRQAQMQNPRKDLNGPAFPAVDHGNSEKGPEGTRGEGGNDGDSYDVYGETGTYGVMQAMDLAKAAETIPFFHALWSKIDGLIDYPIEIAQMRIGGQVTVHMTIDRYGQIEGDFLRVKADHPILKTYTLVILAQALRNPLPVRLQLPAGTQSMPVVVTVDYRSVTLTNLETRRGHFFKNALDFERTRYVDPYLKEIIDYAMTNYVPPIIPIPGGLMIDFVRAYQMIDNYANDRPDLYEQRDRKYAMLKKRLELSVRKKEPLPEAM